MKIHQTLAILSITGALSACAWFADDHAQNISNLSYRNKETEVYLQEPFSRIVARCYASAEDAAQACAAKFEERGYVRLNNIPYKTAKYDFLTKDTYPSRRWRYNELTPRW